MFFIFTPTWGNDPILTNIFQMGWNHQPGMAINYKYQYNPSYPFIFGHLKGLPKPIYK